MDKRTNTGETIDRTYQVKLKGPKKKKKTTTKKTKQRILHFTCSKFAYS